MNDKLNGLNWSAIFDRYFKLLTLFGGLLYICGLIITNLHLGQYGISDIDFLRIQYIITGIVFIIFLFTPWILLIIPIAIIKKESKKWKLWLAMLVGIISFLLCFGFIMFVQSALIAGHGIERLHDSINIAIKAYFPFWIILIFPFNYILYSSIKSYKMDYFLKKRFSPLDLINTIIGVSTLTLCIVNYAHFIHPQIHSAFAGGKPIFSDILISQDGKSIVETLRLNIDSENYLRGIKIIYETESMIYLLNENKEIEEVKVIAIPKKIIEGKRILIEIPVK